MADNFTSFSEFRNHVLLSLEPDSAETMKRDKDKRSVVGYDIYQYSQYNTTQIRYVPMVFDLIIDATLSLCCHLERTLFTKNKDTYLARLQHTGDGGYLFLKTPLHAVIFNTYFYFCLRLLNSCFLFKQAYTLIGADERPLTVRSAITYDDSFEYMTIKDELHGRGGRSGSAVVSCARILARDRLDRCLIDNETYQFFSGNFFGIENLSSYDVNMITHWLHNQIENGRNGMDSSRPEMTFVSNLLQPIRTTLNNRNNGYLECRTHKIGKVTSKNEKLDVYNVEIKAMISVIEVIDVLRHTYGTCNGGTNPGLFDTEKTFPEYLVTTIGNLNTSGLGESRLKIE